MAADSAAIARCFRYWRVRILYSVTIGYACFYLVRQNLNIAIPDMEKHLHISKEKLGVCLTLLGLSYGVSKFINGIWGDRANPRYFMTAGLLLSALMSICFGMSSVFFLFAMFWFVNGWFQGMGCPASIKSLSNWFAPSERGRSFAFWGISQQVGAATVLALGGILVEYNWRLCFLVPAAIALVGVLFLFNRLRDTPESLGLPSAEAMRGEKPEIDHGEKDITTAEFKKLLLRHVFSNPGMWFLCFANFFVYVIRYSFMQWGPTFLQEIKGFPPHLAGVIVAACELAGIGGMLAGGWLSDKLFHRRSSRACVFYMLACTGLVFVFWKVAITSVFCNILLFATIGFAIYGPQILVGVEATNLATKKAASTAVGMPGFFGYLSAIVSGWGMGYIRDHYSWNEAFLLLIGVGLLGTLTFSITAIWDFRRHR